MPRLNEPAPGFEAKTTHGTRRLSDYKGKWLVLFSHPADFTPVCTTEFIGFAKAWPDFQKLNCELLGLSIDSTFAHIAWVRRGQRHVGRSREILDRASAPDQAGRGSAGRRRLRLHRLVLLQENLVIPPGVELKP
jgi:hypothetical protein